MGREPSEDEIVQFSAIAAVGADEARRWVKACNNDVEAALNRFFANEPLPELSNAYDESAFGQDRYGEYQQSGNIPSFQIDDLDSLAPYPRSAAPTRPPSRASHRSTESGLQLGDGNISGRASQASFHAPGQETGVTRQIGDWDNTPEHSWWDNPGTGTHFGPATKAEYDEAKWGMTIVGSTTQEFIPDLDPPQRKREGDEPVFMKPLPSSDYLPALVTILHSIPAVRNAVLAFPIVAHNYGYNPSWWSGTPIRPLGPKEVSAESSLASTRYTEVIQESQRLMAFLDQSARSYGTVEVLGGFKAIEEAVEPDSSVESLAGKFLVVLRDASVHCSAPQLAELLYSTVSTADQEVGFSCFTQLLEDPPDRLTRSLYDIFDQQMFSEESPEETTYITRIGKVFTVRLMQQCPSAKGVNVDIPATWFADRYLEENHEITQEMCRSIRQCAKDIERIKERHDKLSTFAHFSTGNSVDALTLLKTSILAFENAKETEAVEPEDELLWPQEEELPTRYTKIISQIQAVYENVERKLKALDAEKKKTQARLEKLRTTLTEFDSSSNLTPKLKYTLRGVSTEPRITYLLQPEATNNSMRSTETSKMSQWWKLEYVYAASQPDVIKTKVTEEEVLKAAKEEYKHVLLVYATDDAVQADQVPLPSALEAFVERDNSEFLEELNKFENPEWVDAGVGDNRQWTNADSNFNTQQENQNHRTSDAEMTEREGAAGLVPHMGTPIQTDRALHSDAVMEDAGDEQETPASSEGSVVHIEFAG